MVLHPGGAGVRGDGSAGQGFAQAHSATADGWHRFGSVHPGAVLRIADLVPDLHGLDLVDLDAPRRCGSAF